MIPSGEMTPKLNPNSLEIIAELNLPPGNVAISNTGRIFFNTHPEYQSLKGFSTSKIMEQLVDEEGKKQYKSFPDAEFQSKIITCSSMRIDNQNRLWLLDFANMATKDTPKLFAFQLKSDSDGEDSFLFEYSFPSKIAGFGSLLNDFNVSPDGNYIYIADTSIVAAVPAIIFFSIRDKTSYRLLNGHQTMYGQSSFLNISGTVLKVGPFGIKLNVDSIALSRDGKALYYGALTGKELLCIDTSYILSYINAVNNGGDITSSLSALEANIHTALDRKPATDGITIDDLGNIYMTAIEHSMIAVAKPTKKFFNMIEDATSESACQVLELLSSVKNIPLLRWPEMLSFGPDGLYITSSALHIKFSGGSTEDNKPYYITRIPSESLKTIMNMQSGYDEFGDNDGEATLSSRLKTLSGQ